MSGGGVDVRVEEESPRLVQEILVVHEDRLPFVQLEVFLCRSVLYRGLWSGYPIEAYFLQRHVFQEVQLVHEVLRVLSVQAGLTSEGVQEQHVSMWIRGQAILLNWQA